MGKEKKNGSKFVKFSSLGVQMIVLIGGGAWGGQLLDDKMQNEKPAFTIIFSLLGIFTSLYFVIREANKLSKDD
ncbi:AtpZ/AtpI family protein [Crocinitomicaceae bacterium]|nr:AtpZ/AtpI family protein [Crocinitomicaceae bacterium]|tara:strand:- start:2215 stop:2436 length:222 start_codon:yes stop_codon:yes gene_type:complete